MLPFSCLGRFDRRENWPLKSLALFHLITTRGPGRLQQPSQGGIRQLELGRCS